MLLIIWLFSRKEIKIIKAPNVEISYFSWFRSGDLRAWHHRKCVSFLSKYHQYVLEQGLERYRPYQAPHIKPPISGHLYQAPYHIKPPHIKPPPPHIRPPISRPPYQAPHVKPPTISSLPYQAPNIKPSTKSNPPYQAPHDTPYQAPTNHIKPLTFYRQYYFKTHHIRPRPTISSPWHSIVNMTSWHTISGPDQPNQAPDILSSILLHDTPYQAPTNHIKPLPTISSPWHSIVIITSWHTISGPDQPNQAPDILSSILLQDTPYQAPTNHIKPLTFYHTINTTSRHTISGPDQPYQAPDILSSISRLHDFTPYQAPTNQIKPLIFYRQYYFMTHHIRPLPTISSPWYSIVNTTWWHTISVPDQPCQVPDILSSIWLHYTPYQALSNHIKPLILYGQYDFMTSKIWVGWVLQRKFILFSSYFVHS